MQEGLRKTHPHYFTDQTGLAGPSSTTEAPTLHQSTVAPTTPASSAVASTAAKRPADSSSGGPSAKISNLSTDGVSSTDEEMPLTGTGKEQADIGSSDNSTMVYHVDRPLSIFENRNNVYRKVHKFMTFGLAPNILPYETGTGPTAATTTWLTSYLAEIPWHIPALYMTQGEFNNLNAGAQVEAVTIEVFYRGTTIQFETAATTSGLATLNQINDIAVAHALNKSGQGSNVSYTAFNATQSMIPTGITRPKYDAVGNTYRGMLADYYGTNNDNANFQNFIPHHQLGRQTFLYNYWAQSAQAAISGGDAARFQFGGWPTLADKIQQMDGKTAVNTCVLKSMYKPKLAPITTPLTNLGHGLPIPRNPTTPMLVTTGGNLVEGRIASENPSGIISTSTGQPVTSNEVTGTYSNEVLNMPTFDLYSPIEKSQFMRTGSWGEMDAHVQPSIHVGVQPVPSLTTSSTLTSSTEDGQWTDVRAYWEVVATMHTKEHDPTAYPWSTTPNVPVGDALKWMPTIYRPAMNANPRNDGATWGGLYTQSVLTPLLGADI